MVSDNTIFLRLSLVVTVLFSQTAHASYQRRPTRAPFMTALQNNLGRGNERILMSNRRPIAEVRSRNQIGMPNTVMAREGLPNTRFIQPKCPCQTETPCQKMQDIQAMTRTLSPYMLAPTLPIVPSAPVPPAPMAIFPPIPEVAAVPNAVPTVITETCSCREPAALVSPFLPAASPVSAWAPPTSNLLPPIMLNQGRNHFLRKIPIPPPTL